MRHPVSKVDLVNRWFVVFFFLTSVCFAAAQDATPPPPPDAQPPSIQQPAPDTNVRAVRLSDVQGTVQVLNGSEVAFSQAQLNMPMVEGMRVVAAEDGRAEIQFEDGGVVRITPNSSITLTQLSRRSDGTTVTVIRADAGLTYYELNGRAGQYTVRFGQDSVVPLDSSIFRVDLDNAPAELAVTHGSVHATDEQDLVADVHTNQSIRFDAQHPDEYQLLQSVTANTWDQWNSDRDQALAELDVSATAARADTGNPDDPAWSDLDANGDWYNVPGYGMAWSPSGVGQDWDPYGVGSWGYYNDIGYTWISGYSWGWWPYHCGAWSWFDGFGWMWFPGNCGWGGIDAGGGWYPYGTILGVPPGYRCPRRPLPIHHHPGHKPFSREPLIAVNRGPQFTRQIRSVGGVKAAPRVFEYDGQKIAPVVASIHPRQGGPLGEGFTSTVQRTNPGSFIRRANGGTGYRPSEGAGHPVYQPSGGYTPPNRGYTPPSRSYTPPSRSYTPPSRSYSPPSSSASSGAARGSASAPSPAAASRPHR